MSTVDSVVVVVAHIVHGEKRREQSSSFVQDGTVGGQSSKDEITCMYVVEGRVGPSSNTCMYTVCMYVCM